MNWIKTAEKLPRIYDIVIVLYDMGDGNHLTRINYLIESRSGSKYWALEYINVITDPVAWRSPDTIPSHSMSKICDQKPSIIKDKPDKIKYLIDRGLISKSIKQEPQKKD